MSNCLKYALKTLYQEVKLTTQKEIDGQNNDKIRQEMIKSFLKTKYIDDLKNDVLLHYSLKPFRTEEFFATRFENIFNNKIIALCVFKNDYLRRNDSNFEFKIAIRSIFEEFSNTKIKEIKEVFNNNFSDSVDERTDLTSAQIQEIYNLSEVSLRITSKWDIHEKIIQFPPFLNLKEFGIWLSDQNKNPTCPFLENTYTVCLDQELEKIGNLGFFAQYLLDSNDIPNQKINYSKSSFLVGDKKINFETYTFNLQKDFESILQEINQQSLTTRRVKNINYVNSNLSEELTLGNIRIFLSYGEREINYK